MSESQNVCFVWEEIQISINCLTDSVSNRIFWNRQGFPDSSVGKESACNARAAAAAKSLQSCPTLCDPIDGSPPGSPVPGILQAKTLEWVAISFSNAWKWKVKVKSLSRVRLLETSWTAAYQAPHPWDFPGKSTGVGCHCLLRLPMLLTCYYLVGYYLAVLLIFLLKLSFIFMF